jgi:hypothetical protein
MSATDWLCGVTYKPGWAIRHAGVFGGDEYIVVEATGPDSNDPGGRFSASPLFKVPDGVSREQFYDWIVDDCIPGVECHERWEWFRVGGVKWRDPHASSMPAFATGLG